MEVVVADDSVTDHVYHEEIKRENGQSERDDPEVVNVKQKQSCHGKGDDCFQYFEVVVQCCQFCRGDRAEYPEQVHEIDIVNQVRGEVKRFFYQIKTEVVVQAHEYP